MKLLYATNNKNKVKEVKKLLKGKINKVEFYSLNDLDYEIEVEENKKTLEENAYKKAYEVWLKEKENFDFIIAEDFGFFCDQFSNIMGVRSKRWFKGSDDDRSSALIKLLKGVKNREAYYKSVFVMFDKKGTYNYFKGILNGSIANKKSDNKGFAYDGVFLLSDGNYLSDLSLEEKNKISSRAKAVNKLCKKLV